MTKGTRAQKQGAEDASETILGLERPRNSAQRDAVLQGLLHIAKFDPISDPRSFHGRLPYAKQLELAQPSVTWDSQEARRPDGSELDPDDPDELTASEYTDTPEVLAVKVKLLKELLLCS